ncbi:hypothetical protein Acsp05_15110 [Actinokineospora sp. NBRC 105648]|nr:hypothetical protein Acsp05_15110 [Actinokineospora sp. NBRC 105648]
MLIDREPWTVQCHDAVDRPRSLLVHVRGSTVVVTVPPGEVAALGPAQAEEFHSVLIAARREAGAPAPGAPGQFESASSESMVERYSDGSPPSVVGHAASPPCCGGATGSSRGPTATPEPQGADVCRS